MATTQTADRTIPATKAKPFQFSLLTSFYAAGWIMALESLKDIYQYCLLQRIDALAYFIGGIETRMVTILGLKEVYGYCIDWCLPPLIVGWVLGRRLGRNGLLYTMLGVFVFLVVLHNFRGLVFRHNIFEMADQIRSGEVHLPHPLFWDCSYFVAGLIGSGSGWASRRLRPVRRKTEQTDNTVGETASIRAGYFCAGIGLVESLVSRFDAQPKSYTPLLQITHGYVVLACGLLFACLPFIKDRWLDYDIS